MPLGDAKHVSALRKKGAISIVIQFGLLGIVHSVISLPFHVYIAVGIQLGVFILHGYPFLSERYFDISGSFTHLALTVTSLLLNRVVRSPRQIFVAVASILWMTRLGTYLYGRILKDGKDGRFDTFKLTFLSFLNVWVFQAAWVAIVQLPVMLVNSIDDSSSSSSMFLPVFDGICMLIWFVGFIIEVIADTEKMVFRNDEKNKHKYITSGIWSLSRHPNYFGEILMWSALSMISSNVALEHNKMILHAAWMSPIFTFLLLRFASGVPMIEKAGHKKWGNDPNYVKYMKETSMIIPWFPPKGIKRE
jgi:steroid 5-alpha reductase family enzyme